MRTETKQPATLKDGEHLSKPEYWQRYEPMPEDFRAELLEGIVWAMSGRVSARDHGFPHANIMNWLSRYSFETPGVTGLGPVTIDISDDSMPEPDACMVIDHPTIGQTHVNQRDYLVGPPELIVEVEASSIRKDTVTKKRIYEKAGVKEYIIWRTLEDKLDWFVLCHDRYEELEPFSDGFLKSVVFPGLWLDREAMLHRDVRKVVKRMQAGMESQEYRAFVERLLS